MQKETSVLRVKTTSCQPFKDQRMGTAGLRKKVSVFAQPHYLESFLQAVLDTLALPEGAAVVLGGDGRYLNDKAIQVIIRMCAAAGIRSIIVGQNGLLSTPAASNLIRTRRAQGGFLLTASHNPGGPDGDFGIKFNMPSGGQAPEHVTDAVYRASTAITSYRHAELPDIDLSRVGLQQIGPVRIEVVDPVYEYQQLMEKLFDFGLISRWLSSGHTVRFDGMNGITGPYARHILCNALGAPEDTLINATPLPDFGGLHPDPNPVDGRHLVQICLASNAPDLAAASDGDGDRNMILGPRFMLSPGDSVAMMLANISHVPGYRDGIPGVARSMPTSRALDRVAESMGLPCYETPTGWRFFCNLLEAGRIGLCGEESFGTGSWHAREKDGLWAVLFWLNILAARNVSLPELATAHWARFGRHYYQRHDYDIADASVAAELMKALRDSLPALPGKHIETCSINAADDFHYVDPVDGSESAHQGVRVWLTDGSRIVYRLSGTGTTGATLRTYLECFEQDPARHQQPTTKAVEMLGRAAAELARIREMTGLTGPSMVI